MDGKNTIIFTIGRMNPPTPGHMKLIQTIMDANADLPEDDKGRGRVYIILSHTKDNKKNPLSCDRKKTLFLANGMIDKLKKTHKPKFDGIDVDILCTYEPNKFSGECGTTFISSQLCRIIKSEQKMGRRVTNAELILGSDRQDAFGQLPAYFKKQNIIFNDTGPDGNRVFQEYDDRLTRVEPKGNEAYIDNEDMPIMPENMSGTLIRSLVEKKQKARFVKLYENAGLSESDATNLFDELYYELYNKVPSAKPSAKPVTKAKSKPKTKKSLSPDAASGNSSSPSSPSSPPYKRNRSVSGRKGGMYVGVIKTKKYTRNRHRHNNVTRYKIIKHNR